MMRILRATATLALIAGCSPPADTNATAANESAAKAVATPKPVRSKTPEESFADTVASADVFAITAGKMAEERGGSAAVKALGTALIKEHNRSTMELKMAASRSGAGLFIDPSLSDEQNAQLKALEAATGPAFDTAFKTQQVAAHNAVIAAMENYRTGGAEMPLKTYAYVTQPKFRALLAKAQAL